MQNNPSLSCGQSQTSQPQSYPPQPTSIGYDQQIPTYNPTNYATQYSQKPASFVSQETNVTSQYPKQAQVGADSQTQPLNSFVLPGANNPAFEGNVVVLRVPNQQTNVVPVNVSRHLLYNSVIKKY